MVFFLSDAFDNTVYHSRGESCNTQGLISQEIHRKSRFRENSGAADLR